MNNELLRNNILQGIGNAKDFTEMKREYDLGGASFVTVKEGRSIILEALCSLVSPTNNYTQNTRVLLFIFY